MITYQVFDTEFDVTMNGKPLFRWMCDVKANSLENAMYQAKSKGVTAPIIQPKQLTN